MTIAGPEGGGTCCRSNGRGRVIRQRSWLEGGFVRGCWPEQVVASVVATVNKDVSTVKSASALEEQCRDLMGDNNEEVSPSLEQSNLGTRSLLFEGEREDGRERQIRYEAKRR